MVGLGWGGPLGGAGRFFIPGNPRAKNQECPRLKGQALCGNVRAQIAFLLLIEMVGLVGGSEDRVAHFVLRGRRPAAANELLPIKLVKPIQGC